MDLNKNCSSVWMFYIHKRLCDSVLPMTYLPRSMRVRMEDTELPTQKKKKIE